MIRFAIALSVALVPFPSFAMTAPFINELHYDNGSTDVGEGIEIAGVAGTVLDGWSLVFYNGSTGSVYRTTKLSGAIANQADGYGALFFATGALQNGAPDGVALVDDSSSVQQFLSYEGSFLAITGAAAGLISLDIGVSESSDTNVGWSLQLTGTGLGYEDFSWVSGLQSYGAINPGQSFTPVPLPASLPLLVCAIGWLLSRPRCKRT
ncbi:MAG: hypothetical protein OEQ74_00925 [Gammaproteobacteria bacterium]|nr:hypothetical protein [Gammaproteobacteria bacterium]